MTTLVRDVQELGRLDPARARVRDILVHVQPEAQAEPRIRAAAHLARMLEARLCGVAAEMIPSIAVSDPYGLLAGEFVVPLQAQIEVNLREAEVTFRRHSQDLETQWTVTEDDPVAVMARMSRAADLIVAGGSPLNYRDGSRWCDPGRLVVSSGRPVLVAPPDGAQPIFEAILVAWKETREARRALADSLPFLQSAYEVAVMEVCREEELGEAQFRTFSVVESLKRHGVKAQAITRIAHPDAAAAELNLAAANLGADLIVAGGYGHTRLGEWAFGGVTRDLLMHPERFVLLSH